MTEKTILKSLLLLSFVGVIKATQLGMKLMILALCGLAGMYMIHLLAQDYNKYQTLNRPGRSIHDERQTHHPTISPEFGDVYSGANISAETAARILEDIEKTESHYKRNELITLDRILLLDPTGCARRYVCTIATKSPKKQTQSEKNIIQMLRSLPNKRRSDSGQEAFNYALNLGRRKKDAEACAEEYPKCLFSISQMLKLVGIS